MVGIIYPFPSVPQNPWGIQNMSNNSYLNYSVEPVFFFSWNISTNYRILGLCYRWRSPKSFDFLDSFIGLCRVTVHPCKNSGSIELPTTACTYLVWSWLGLFLRNECKQVGVNHSSLMLRVSASPRETSFAHSQPQGYERCTSGKARNAISLILRKSPEESGVGVTEVHELNDFIYCNNRNQWCGLVAGP